LPDSIGRIWKVQVWHNNQGASPSWYLSRVIVRDLNAGHMFTFLCEKWLAVEEQDGKVEREFMALDGTLDFTKVRSVVHSTLPRYDWLYTRLYQGTIGCTLDFTKVRSVVGLMNK